jgi:membrane protein implicated in regulation of membrane protease activity
VDPWVAWIIAALVLGVLELVTGGTLFLAMVAGGALAGALTAALVDNSFAPWAVFAIVSIGLIVAVRPVAARHVRQPTELRSGVDRLVGLDAVVIEAVSGAGGRVKLNGEVWSARSFDHAASFPAGTTVVVLEIEGATALVA